LLGSVDGALVANVVPIPGSPLHLATVEPAFDIAILIRWLDFNDTWLAAESGHESHNPGALLPSLAKAYEIQGMLALSTLTAPITSCRSSSRPPPWPLICWEEVLGGRGRRSTHGPLRPPRSPR